MSTYWIPAGEDGVTETTYGIYMKLVGNEGIDNFETNAYWQIGMSIDGDVEESEI